MSRVLRQGVLVATCVSFLAGCGGDGSDDGGPLAAAGPVPAFEIVVSAGGGTVTQGLIDGQPNPATFPNGIPSGATPLNTALRISDSGAFLGEFVTDGTPLEDPRDIIFFVPDVGFAANDPLQFSETGFPDNGTVVIVGGENRIAQYDFDGTFLGNIVDFGFVVPGTGIQLNAGGIVVGPGGNLFAGARPPNNNAVEFDPEVGTFLGTAIPDADDIEFIRGFVFSPDGNTLFVGNGSAPVSSGGSGAGAIAIVDLTTDTVVDTIVDPDLSPLDVILTPNGTLLTSSEAPFGDPNAFTSVREYDPATGELLSVCLVPDGVDFLSPRGLGIGPDGLVYASSTGSDSIVRFDLTATGCEFVDIFAQVAGLNGQGFAFIPAE